jgi:hypothetical protein
MGAELRFWLLNGLRYAASVAVFMSLGAMIGRFCRPRSGVAFAATCIGTALLYLAVLLITAPQSLSRASTAYDFITIFGGWALVGVPAIPVALFLSSHVPRTPKI